MPDRGALRRFLADALRWSSAGMPSAGQAIAAALGIAGPIAAGGLAGHLQIGLAAALGGLALSDGGTGDTPRKRAVSIALTLLAGCAAMLCGALVIGHGTLTAVAVIILVLLASLLVTLSRPAGAAATQFILFTLIAMAFARPGDRHPVAPMVLFALGAAWTAALSLWLRPTRSAPAATPTAAADRPSTWRRWRFYLQRWWASLHSLAGWLFTLRLTLCMAVAELVMLVWPLPRANWIALTVAIVVRRDLPSALLRTAQRAIGTMFGILLGSLILLGQPPLWCLILSIAVLAGLRPILREANYLAYAIVMTPLIILLTELGRPIGPDILLARLAATVAGCAIAIVFGYVLWLSVPTPPSAPSPRRR